MSHWAFGDAEASRDGFSWAHTLVGAATQHAASIFWALVHDVLFTQSRWRPTVARLGAESAATSALACAVDYTITPKRLTPGYELRLSKPDGGPVYVAFAGGLLVGSLMLPSDER